MKHPDQGALTIFFVRHGQTEWNASGRMQGRANSDLTGIGRQQADANGRLLARLSIEGLYASPLERTRQTAEIVQRHVPLPVTYDARLVEWDCGDWSGHRYAEVQARWPEEWAAYRADRFNYRGPNCETYPDMIARVQPFLDALRAGAERRVAVISHGMIGRVMVSLLLGHDRQQMLSYHQPNDVVFAVEIGAHGAEVSHYLEGDGPRPGLDVAERPYVPR